MNRIVISPSWFEIGAQPPAGFDRLNLALIIRRTTLHEIDTSDDLFLIAVGSDSPQLAALTDILFEFHQFRIHLAANCNARRAPTTRANRLPGERFASSPEITLTALAL
jgi:hypothetical protein